jgi:hypothetical protein
MADQHRPDVKTLTPVETQHITAECRDNQSMMLAFHYAKEALWTVYRAQVERRPGATVSIALYVTDPDAG